MPKGPFLPSDFTATKFSTAADKAEFGNTLLRFIESEWASALFTKRFYNRLSMCFSHIAHYNRTQFYEEWFLSLAAQVQFLKHTLRFPCYGDPEYTFSDVERAIQREIVNRNYLARYELRLAEEHQATDVALLRQLESKYRTPVGEQGQEPEFDRVCHERDRATGATTARRRSGWHTKTAGCSLVFIPRACESFGQRRKRSFQIESPTLNYWPQSFAEKNSRLR